MHLSELVHAEAMRRKHGPFALLAWYRRMRADFLKMVAVHKKRSLPGGNPDA